MGHQCTSAPHATTPYARAIWHLIASMAVLTVAGFLLTGLRVDPFSRPLLLLPFGVLGVTLWIYGSVRPDARLYTLAETCLQLLLVLLLGTMLSYTAAALPLPLQDANLLAIDNALGLDRRAYIAFFDSRPWLFNTVTLAYFSFMPQFMVVLLALFAAKQPLRMQQFVLAAGAALFVTDAISVLTPSITTIYLDLGLPVGAEIPAHRYTPLPTLQALRSGLPYWIDLSAVEGLISFPSFHTVGAILFVWGLWTVRYVRWIALALNTALIAATPFIGAHYFIDLAGGAAVALFAVSAARRLSRRAASSDSAMDAVLSGQTATAWEPAE
jgi:hypothetical protein